jgi:hypothetical protein
LHVCSLPVLDLTDELVRDRLGVTEAELVGNDYAVCHEITDLLRTRPDLFGGILAPSAAIRDEQTLVIFQDRIGAHVSVPKEAKASRFERLTAPITIANTITSLVGAGAAVAALLRYVL